MPDARSTRDIVLDAALDLFGTRGFEATPLDQIAVRAGVTKQTLLYHFGDKDRLLAAVIDRTASEVAAALDAGLGSPDSTGGWVRVELVVRATFRMAARRPALLGMLREVSRLGGGPAAQLTAALEPLVARATAFLEREMAADRMRQQDPRLVLLTAYSTVVAAATEVEVLRIMGIEPTARTAVERRRALLSFLRAALV